MKIKEEKIVEWILRLALSTSMLSAVADRFGWWGKDLLIWGNWDNFLVYTQKLNPWVPDSLIGLVGTVATFFEVFFAIALLTTYKTPLIAKGTGFLLLIFGLAMAASINIKAPLDYSVFTASGAAFALGVISKR